MYLFCVGCKYGILVRQFLRSMYQEWHLSHAAAFIFRDPVKCLLWACTDLSCPRGTTWISDA